MTKTAIKKHVQEILAKYAPGSDLDNADFKYMDGLLKSHPREVQKRGCGILKFRVVINLPYKTKGFELERTDGSISDFSYLECLRPTSEASANARFNQACRQAVAQDILEFKSEAFASVSTLWCPITGVPLTWNTCHVHHVPPNTFKAIVKKFLAEHDLKGVKYSGFEDGEMVISFQDKVLSEKFRAFHMEHAHLQIVSPEANLSMAKE